jgi:shikimate dehydrogenase
VSGPFSQPIEASTRYCAVYGHPVIHSASPAMQNAGIAALGLDWRYVAFDVHPENLRAAIAGAKAMRFVGINLTVPHKMLALEMMDILDDSARAWGAVNTVLMEGCHADGNWRPLRDLSEAPKQIRCHGFNTDADAITRALREDLGIQLQGARVVVLGAGGAGRTAALKLASENVAELFLVNRTQEKAAEVVSEIKQRHPGVKVALSYPAGNADLILNATSLGLKPGDPLPLDEQQFPLTHAGAVYDMIYRPAETPLLKKARAAGCRTANGLGMLLYQGARALEIWSGQTAPVEIMRQALERHCHV